MKKLLISEKCTKTVLQIRITKQLKQPEKKKAVVEEIKKEVKPSIREKLALNVAKIQREEAERKQLNKGRSHSSDLEL